jgi:hypothetical protein
MQSDLHFGDESFYSFIVFRDINMLHRRAASIVLVEATLR